MKTKNALQGDAAKIFTAQRAAERLLERIEEADGAVIRMSCDEVHALARDLEDVAAIASRHHLIAAGSLPPESFPPPTE